MMSTPNSQEPSCSSKVQDGIRDEPGSKRVFSTYNKREFLTALMMTNCNPDKTMVVQSRFRFPPEKIEAVKEFINEQAAMSQNRVDYVMGKVGDKQYANLTTTAERLSQNVEKSRNDNLFSLACEHIQHSELLPDPADVNGINLKQLYSWMGNACAGYPIDIDDGPTKDFLLKCYKELMDSTDSLDVNDLRNHLDNQDEDVRQVYSWITNSEYNSDYVPRIFGETNRK